MNLNGKRVDLPQLKAELVAAGINVTALGQAGDILHTYDAAGQAVDLPPAAAAVVAAHVPPPVPPQPNYGNDAADVDRQAAQAVSQLRTFIANGSPTNAEVVAQVKLNARVLLALMRRSGL
jgi:hypothetical protein